MDGSRHEFAFRRPLESPRTRHCFANSPLVASLRQSGPQFVIPAKAGIQEGRVVAMTLEFSH